MKVVIDIPEDVYTKVKQGKKIGLNAHNISLLTMWIFYGTPLPKGLIPINDVMSVFDDFMCGDLDEDGMETFYEMLKERVIEVDKKGADNEDSD